MKGPFRNGHPDDLGETSVNGGQPLLSIDSALLKDVRVVLQASLGELTLSVGELLALKGGSVLKLDTSMSEAIEIRLNDAVVAWGEIVAVDDNFAVRIIEIAQR
jgi:flagellar motor switch protein FliN/FliY